MFRKTVYNSALIFLSELCKASRLLWVRYQGLFSSVRACTFRVPRIRWSWIGEEYGGEWIPVYVWLSPFDVHLKLSQHCLLISCTPIQNKKLGGKKEYAGGFQSPYILVHQLFKFFLSASYLLQILILLQYSTVQSLSRVQLFATPWTSARQASLSINNSWSLLKLMSIESAMPTISSSVVPFSSCLQSFPSSGSFQMSQFFTSGGQILELQLHHQSFE